MLLLCSETDNRDSDNNQADGIEAFSFTSSYLDDLLYIDTPYFEQMVSQTYPTELLLGWVLCFALFSCALLFVLSSFVAFCVCLCFVARYFLSFLVL